MKRSTAFASAMGVVLALTGATVSAQQWGAATSVPVPPNNGGQHTASGNGPVPLAGIGYLGPAKQALVGAGMAVPSADKAFFGTDRTTCPPRAQSNDFSRNNPGVCDNY